ncbi:ABC transporter substrate-binding protein [Lachnoclostridium sp. Marseille-P6806]|uniref:ABC transporter substrate-binding protein n=1 Tax=Lachnoclostridium sp. Marseille-P6806 TaxID=2364793 RepID=UPI0010318D79|nr:ABC transporter substrate-binding protein [Lachnoclostridium sp. Marseille-P6806]
MKKNVIAAIAAAAMGASLLAGCGNAASSAAASGTAPAAEGDLSTLDTSKEVELTMYVVSDRPAGQDLVDENFNRLLKEKLNATLKINWIGWAEYQQKYPMLFSSGESFDMAYCAGWLNFSNLARKGAFMALDDMLKAYAPDNYALQSESALSQATIDGHLYAVPTLLPTYTAYGAIYRGDLAEEAGMTDPIDTFDEIEKFADYIVANHPEMEAIDEYSMGPEFSLTWTRSIGWKDIDSGLRYLYFNPSEAKPVVTPFYDMEGAAEFYEKMKTWSDKGFWTKSALADTDSTKTQNGKAALRLHNIDTYSNYAVLHPEWNFKFGAMTSDVAHLPYTQDCMVISNTAKNPERALALWNWVTTDQEAYDAFFYGVLGTSYELNDDGQFKILDNDLYATSAMWAVRTMELNRNAAGTPADYDEVRAEWEKSIETGRNTEKFTGFVLDTTNITTEVAACTNAFQQYGWPLELGYTEDVEASLTEYRTAMEAAGITKVQAECQRQLDEYLAAQSK